MLSYRSIPPPLFQTRLPQRLRILFSKVPRDSSHIPTLNDPRKDEEMNKASAGTCRYVSIFSFFQFSKNDRAPGELVKWISWLCYGSFCFLIVWDYVDFNDGWGKGAGKMRKGGKKDEGGGGGGGEYE